VSGPASDRRGFLRQGGWVLLAGAAAALLVAAWWLAPMLGEKGPAPVGDGRDPGTYGFDLSGLDAKRGALAAAGFPRDGLPRLDFPALMDAAGVDSLNGAERGKYLVGGDRVIGLSVGGSARAYPLRVMDWHEVVNDTLGGLPLAVTWSPLCGSAVVYDRRGDGRPLELGHSGLLLESNPLLFDRAAPGAGLWCQLTGEALAGPVPGSMLRALPMTLTTWEEWRKRQPGTTVPRPAPAMKKHYARNPYGSYVSRGRPRFPVTGPLPAQPMEPLVIVALGATRVAYPVNELAEQAGEMRPVPRVQDHATLVFICTPRTGAEPATAWPLCDPPRGDLDVRYAYRFAWEALGSEGAAGR